MSNIQNLYRYELRRLYTSKSVYLCMGAVLLCQWLSVAVQKLLVLFQGLVSEIPITLFLPSSISIALSAVVDGSYTLMLAIALSIYICGDYSRRTVRTVISSGYSKAQIYIANWAIAVLVAFASWILTVTSGLLCGLVFSDGWTISVLPLRLIAQLTALIAYTSLYVFVCTAMRKTSAALVVNIVISSTGSFVASMITAVVSYGQFECASLIWAWLPDSVLSMLSKAEYGAVDMLICALVMLAWIVVAFGLGFRASKRADV